MNPSTPSVSLHFSPVLPLSWLIIITLLAILFLSISLWRSRRAVISRSLTFICFLLILLNPSILKQERNYVQDVGVIIVDRSMSQNTGQRMQRTDLALDSLKKQLDHEKNLDLRIIEAPPNGSLEKDTRLFEALDLAFSNVPYQRRAGAIFITDGQIHDVPTNTALFTQYGPVHGLLSGEHEEKDRQVVITQAPAYGLVGENVIVKYMIDDTSNTGQTTANVIFRKHDGSEESINVPVGVEQSLSLPIEHSGQNVFELETDILNNEITSVNNKAALLVNGVRDRLKVLLVSGTPHAGGRTWRDLLTSDPGVDLVHFTILREPDKIDLTPQNELSLIAFPFRELFEIKLYDFDLIIFDRYHLNRILPNQYFDNIAKYVEEGGAFLEASGPSFAGEDSVYMTSLMNILPGSPTGQVFEQPFVPKITDLGHRHPVTNSLVWGDYNSQSKDEPTWGHWLRQVDINPEAGDVLMSGVNSKPLLLLARVKKGRVAQIASDHIWLWSRGYENGGPYAELLRRTVHWLMKEPELDERALDVHSTKNIITIRKQYYTKETESIAMTTPDGGHEVFDLSLSPEGWLEHKVVAKNLGIYAFEDTEGERRFAIMGDLNPLELVNLRTTAEKLNPIAKASGGSLLWLSDTPQPTIKLVSNSSRSFAGNGWIGFKQNNDYTVTGVKDITLLPEWMSLCLLLLVITFSWWREGKMK